MKNRSMMLPMLARFFVMGFGDIIGTVMNQVKAECAADATPDADFRIRMVSAHIDSDRSAFRTHRKKERRSRFARCHCSCYDSTSFCEC
jgi:hypothetical protein